MADGCQGPTGGVASEGYRAASENLSAAQSFYTAITITTLAVQRGRASHAADTMHSTLREQHERVS
jgi:hypothetical protein